MIEFLWHRTTNDALTKERRLLGFLRVRPRRRQAEDAHESSRGGRGMTGEIVIEKAVDDADVRVPVKDLAEPPGPPTQSVGGIEVLLAPITELIVFAEPANVEIVGGRHDRAGRAFVRAAHIRRSLGLGRV